jgi:hypothetical protein
MDAGLWVLALVAIIAFMVVVVVGIATLVFLFANKTLGIVVLVVLGVALVAYWFDQLFGLWSH